MKDLLILGATGSIGRSALDVVRAHPEHFRIVGLVAGQNARLLAEAALEFDARFVALGDPTHVPALREHLAQAPCSVFAGANGVLECVASCGADLCLSAVVGSAGLLPTLGAVDAGMDLALANKEALVAAGHILTKRVRECGVRLLPVDSEHNAVFQCLANADPASVRRILLTASGGPFRGRTADELADVRPEDALSHPTWSMGHKITVDSATLANKALEVIEAHWLFEMPYDRIDVVVHPQSLVHSLVEYVDGTTIAQLAVPDMRIPIQFALSYPERLASPWAPPDLCAVGTLQFEPPDRSAFPMLDLGYQAGQDGGAAPAVFSAANEEAVQAFLAGRIGFPQIPALVAAALEALPTEDDGSLEKLLAMQRRATAFVRERIDSC